MRSQGWWKPASQKRTLFFGEYVTDEVLLKLPHKFFTLPKALRIFLRNDKYLFSDISKLIYTLIEDFYTESAGQKILSGSCFVAAHVHPCTPRHLYIHVQCTSHSVT